MTSYQDILSTPMKDIKDPPATPAGTYLATVVGLPKIDKFGQRSTDGVEFSFKLVAPLGDVNPEDLQAAGGLPDKLFNYCFWLTKDAIPILRQFLVEILGQDESMTPGEGITQAPGAQVNITLKHIVAKKTNRTIAVVDGFSRAE